MELGFRVSGDRGVFWKPQRLFLVAKPSQGGQEGVEGALSPIESLPGPFLKLPGWGGDHCGSDLALSCSYPCQLAATSVSPPSLSPRNSARATAEPSLPDPPAQGVKGRTWT